MEFANVCISVVITNGHEYINMMVSNDFDPDNEISATGSGTGLKNIADRLNLFYGNRASMNTKIVDRKFIVTVNIPSNFEYHN